MSLEGATSIDFSLSMTVASLLVGAHFVPVSIMSSQTRPFSSMLGCHILVLKVTMGGLKGNPSSLNSTSNVPPWKAEPSGPAR